MKPNASVFMKIVSFAIIFSMVFSGYSFTSYAQGNDDKNSKQGKDNLVIPYCIPEDAPKRDKHVKELPEFENETTVAFLNNDGSSTYYIFDIPVKYKNKEGKYEYIDNSLVDVKETSKQEKGFKYKTKSNNISVYFPEDIVSDKNVRLENEDNSFYVEFKPDFDIRTEADKTSGMQYKAQGDQVGELKLSEERKSRKKKKGDKKDSVSYKKSLGDNVDIQYTTVWNGVKEDIILNQYTGQNTFDFILYTNGIPEVQTDNAVIIKDKETGECRSFINRFFATDSFTGDRIEGDGHDTLEITTEITPIEGKEDAYKLRIVIDKSFLENTNTIYPVIIDPTVTINPQNDQGVWRQWDAQVASKYPTTLYHLYQDNRVGYWTSYGTVRSYILFNLGAVQDLNPYAITSATYYAYNTSNYTSNAIAQIYRVTDFWQSWTLCWNNKPVYDPNVLVDSKTINSSSKKYYGFNITSLVTSWMNGTYANNGFIIKLSNESSSAALTRDFISSNCSTNMPYIVVDCAVDTIAPQTPSATVTPSYWTNNPSFTVSWNYLTDSGGSGLNRVEYQMGSTDGEWISLPASEAGSFAVSAEYSGLNFVYVRGVDNSGNIGQPVRVGLCYDTDPPSAPDLSTVPSAIESFVAATSLTLQWSRINDGWYDGNFSPRVLSPIRTIEYQIDSTDGVWTSYTSSSEIYSGSLNINITSSGEHTIYVRGVDTPGNKGDIGEVTYMLDVTGPNAPTLSTEPSASTTWTNVTTPVLNWDNFVDAHSGISKLQWKMNDGSWSDIPDSDVDSGSLDLPQLSASGTYTFYVRGYDVLNNVSAVASIQYCLNVATPEELIGNADINGNNHLVWAVGQGGRDGTGVTYNIYRGTSANFTISASNRLNTVDANGMGISQLYYDDNTGTAGTAYYYKVAAVKNIGTASTPVYRESLPTASVAVACVDSNECLKQIGDQSYWTYSSFNAGAGNGNVNVSSGNLVFSSEDFSFPSILPVDMTRTYNSQSTATSSLGKGWDFSFNFRLYALSNGDIVLKDGDGTLHKFIYNSGTGTYTPEAGLYMSLEYLTTYSLWRVTRKDNIKYLFGVDKRLQRIYDLNGNYLDYVYNAQGNLRTVTSSANEVTTFEYYADADDGGLTGLLKSVTDPAGRIFTYTYNSSRQLVGRSFTMDTDSEIYWTEQFSYNTAGKLETITDGRGKVTSIQYTGNRITRVTSPVASLYTTYSYNDTNHTTTAANQLGQGTIYTYDTNGLVTQETNALGHNTNYTYGTNSYDNRLVTGKSYYNMIDGVNTLIEWSYQYDSNGNQTQVIDPLGHYTVYEYNSLNLMTYQRIKDADNTTDKAVTHYTYDANSKGTMLTQTDAMNRITTYTYYDNGLVHTSTDHFNKTTTYTYNTHGWLTVTEDPLGRTTKTLAFDAMGNPLYSKNVDGTVIKYEYNALGLVVKTYQAMSGVSETNPASADWDGDPFESTEYDLAGNISLSTTPDGVDTVSVNDDINRLSRNTAAPASSNAETTLTYSYDSANNYVETTTDEVNNVSKKYYNAVGWLIKTESDGVTVTYEYDNVGNQIRSVDNEGRETTFKYDKLNRQTDSYDDPSGKNIHSSTTYDILGRVHVQNDGQGAVTTTLYDLVDRPTSVISTKNGVTHSITYDYDVVVTEGSGQYIKSSVSNQITYGGNTYDNGTKETYVDTAGYTYKDVQTLAGGTVFTFLYNTVTSSVTSIKVGTTNHRELVANTYDNSTGLSLLTQATYANGDYKHYTYGETGKLTHERYETDTSERFDYEYDDLDNLSKIKDHARNVETRYTYDNASRITGVSEGAIGFTTPTHTYTIGYTDNNVTSVSETVGSQTNAIAYTYDTNNKLTDANFNYGTGNTAKVHWNYDDYGRVNGRSVFDNNITQIFNTTTTYTENTYASAYVQSIRNQSVGGGYDKTLTYEYDNNDASIKQYNITRVSDGTNQTTYAYDDKQQLVRENNQAAGKTWSWSYNIGGNITEKREYDYTTDADLSSKTYTSIPYTYADTRGWADMLTSYDGNTITYDDSGNPLTDGTWTYTWEGGRNLIGMSKTGTIISYTYNKDGIRTSKTVNGVTTNYTLMGDKVTAEINGTDSIFYRYGSNGELISMNLNGTEYYYFCNAQGDIIGLFDRLGNVVVEYTYDAWGKTLSVTGSLAGTVGVKNPYRYRGYRYDEDTRLYYLQNRYYNPIWHRFINSDSVIIGNLYCYCINNPVMRRDDNGTYSYPASKKINEQITKLYYRIKGDLSNIESWAKQAVSSALSLKANDKGLLFELLNKLNSEWFNLFGNIYIKDVGGAVWEINGYYNIARNGSLIKRDIDKYVFNSLKYDKRIVSDSSEICRLMRTPHKQRNFSTGKMDTVNQYDCFTDTRTHRVVGWTNLLSELKGFCRKALQNRDWYKYNFKMFYNYNYFNKYRNEFNVEYGMRVY